MRLWGGDLMHNVCVWGGLMHNLCDWGGNRNLHYGEPRCGFSTKHQSIKGGLMHHVGMWQAMLGAARYDTSADMWSLAWN